MIRTPSRRKSCGFSTEIGGCAERMTAASEPWSVARAVGKRAQPARAASYVRTIAPRARSSVCMRRMLPPPGSARGDAPSTAIAAWRSRMRLFPNTSLNARTARSSCARAQAVSFSLACSRICIRRRLGGCAVTCRARMPGRPRFSSLRPPRLTCCIVELSSSCQKDRCQRREPYMCTLAVMLLKMVTATLSRACRSAGARKLIRAQESCGAARRSTLAPLYVTGVNGR